MPPGLRIGGRQFDPENGLSQNWISIHLQSYEAKALSLKGGIRCYRIALAKNADDHFLSCTRSYPPPELTELAIQRRRQREVGPETLDWDDALNLIENTAVAKFFRNELKAGRVNNPKYRSMRFYIAGRRRFVVFAKRHWAGVWQGARFDDDLEFWMSRLGKRCGVPPTSGGHNLRFTLRDESDFEKFKQAVSAELSDAKFSDPPDESEIQAAAAGE